MVYLFLKGLMPFTLLEVDMYRTDVNMILSFCLPKMVWWPVYTEMSLKQWYCLRRVIYAALFLCADRSTFQNKNNCAQCQSAQYILICCAYNTDCRQQGTLWREGTSLDEWRKRSKNKDVKIYSNLWDFKALLQKGEVDV